MRRRADATGGVGAPGSYPPIRKSLGQHFLRDRRILERIVDALALTGTETVIEIGAGRGSLSDVLESRARRLFLIEYDRALAGMLRERYAGHAATIVLEADALTVSFADVANGPFSLVGNLPYYLTAPMLFHALARPRPERAVFLVQLEVAQRIVAPAADESYGAMSVNVQAVARPRLLFRVPPGAFHPPPRVSSAVVRIDPRPDPVVSEAEEEPFRRFIQGAFGLRRKQLRRVLRTLLQVSVDRADDILTRANLEPAARPETLTPEQFAVLFRASPTPPA